MGTLIVIVGPTASGKTEISIEFAKRLGSEIISADSRQFYKRMRIGTAAPSDEQMSEVKHHYVRFLNINRYYSASLFERDVMALLPNLFRKDKYAIMTGGSGLYIDAVCDGIDDIPDIEPEIRGHYSSRLKLEGLGSLTSELKEVDPDYYARADLKNPRRVIRALEVYASTGRAYSSFLSKRKSPRPFRIVKVGISYERELLYERINRRTDRMIEQGLIQEARALYPHRHLNALQTVGYRELFMMFDKTTSRDKAIELIKRNTRRYAKRQLTWWARDSSIEWFKPSQIEEMYSYVVSAVKGRE